MSRADRREDGVEAVARTGELDPPLAYRLATSGLPDRWVRLVPAEKSANPGRAERAFAVVAHLPRPGVERGQQDRLAIPLGTNATTWNRAIVAGGRRALTSTRPIRVARPSLIPPRVVSNAV